MKAKNLIKSRRAFTKGVLSAAISASTLNSEPLRSFSEKNIANSISDYQPDILIIGSGPAGLSLADRLTASGIKVLVVETGIDKESTQRQRLNYVLRGDKALPYNIGWAGQRVIGGTTNLWGGVCPRFQPSDLVGGSRYGYGIDWPLEYTELAHYYCAAERWLKVSSGVESEPDPAAECRQRITSPYIKATGGLKEAFVRKGYQGVIPASMSIDQAGNYAPLNLGAELASGALLSDGKNFMLLKDTTARKIDLDKKGRAQGVFCTTFSGKELYLKARLVVLCCGATQNARLLLLSANSLHPDGLGNNNGHAGRWFMEHPCLQYWLEPNRDWLPAPYESAYLHVFHWYESMKKNGFGSALLRVGANRKMPFEGVRYAAQGQTFLLEALCEQEPVPHNRLSLHTERKDQFGDALPRLDFEQSERDRETINTARKHLESLIEGFGKSYSIRPLRLGCHHLMGTTRMSSAEKDGVVDSNLKVFGTTNVYVSGSSVFPTGGAANPTLTLVALSLRLADHILKLRFSALALARG